MSRLLKDMPECNCKLCGSPAELTIWEDYENIEDYYYIACSNEECNQVSTSGLYDICRPESEQACIAEWMEINQ